MITGPYQGRGFGRMAIGKLLTHLRSLGVRELFTSCGQGEASPRGFYARLGFIPTGDMYDDEIEMRSGLAID
jgi:diamine N-acetyltransferase